MGIASGVFAPPSPTRAMTAGHDMPHGCASDCESPFAWTIVMVVVLLALIVLSVVGRRSRKSRSLRDALRRRTDG
ncbi:MAG: hypothetical protein JWQ73_1732 [Variovorax sp.]|nr:hypothetical protein [Variovorax sp.]